MQVFHPLTWMLCCIEDVFYTKLTISWTFWSFQVQHASYLNKISFLFVCSDSSQFSFCRFFCSVLFFVSFSPPKSWQTPLTNLHNIMDLSQINISFHNYNPPNTDYENGASKVGKTKSITGKSKTHSSSPYDQVFAYKEIKKKLDLTIFSFRLWPKLERNDYCSL